MSALVACDSLVGCLSTAPHKPTSGSDWRRAAQEAGPYVGVGATLASSVLGGVGGGYWLDRRFGTSPWFILIGASFGIFAAIYHLFKVVRTGRTKQ